MCHVTEATTVLKRILHINTKYEPIA